MTNKKGKEEMEKDEIKVFETLATLVSTTTATQESVKSVEKKVDEIKEDMSRQNSRITAVEVEVNNLNDYQKKMNENRKMDLKEHKNEHWKFIMASIAGSAVLIAAIQLIFHLVLK